MRRRRMPARGRYTVYWWRKLANQKFRRFKTRCGAFDFAKKKKHGRVKVRVALHRRRRR